MIYTKAKQIYLLPFLDENVKKYIMIYMNSNYFVNLTITSVLLIVLKSELKNRVY